MPASLSLAPINAVHFKCSSTILSNFNGEELTWFPAIYIKFKLSEPVAKPDNARPPPNGAILITSKLYSKQTGCAFLHNELITPFKKKQHKKTSICNELNFKMCMYVSLQPFGWTAGLSPPSSSTSCLAAWLLGSYHFIGARLCR